MYAIRLLRTPVPYVWLNIWLRKAVGVILSDHLDTFANAETMQQALAEQRPRQKLQH